MDWSHRRNGLPRSPRSNRVDRPHGHWSNGRDRTHGVDGEYRTPWGNWADGSDGNRSHGADGSRGPDGRHGRHGVDRPDRVDRPHRGHGSDGTDGPNRTHRSDGSHGNHGGNWGVRKHGGQWSNRSAGSTGRGRHSGYPRGLHRYRRWVWSYPGNDLLSDHPALGVYLFSRRVPASPGGCANRYRNRSSERGLCHAPDVVHMGCEYFSAGLGYHIRRSY